LDYRYGKRFFPAPIADYELVTSSDHQRPAGRGVEVGHALEGFHLQHWIGFESAKLTRRLQAEEVGFVHRHPRPFRQRALKFGIFS
jgi:hypothetical protein